MREKTIKLVLFTLKLSFKSEEEMDSDKQKLESVASSPSLQEMLKEVF